MRGSEWLGTRMDRDLHIEVSEFRISVSRVSPDPVPRLLPLSPACIVLWRARLPPLNLWSLVLPHVPTLPWHLLSRPILRRPLGPRLLRLFLRLPGARQAPGQVFVLLPFLFGISLAGLRALSARVEAAELLFPRLCACPSTPCRAL